MIEHIQPLKEKLAPIYNANRRWSYEEECLLLMLIRVPNYHAEVEQVLEYWQSLPAHGKQFFPQSMARLLSDWTGILDKAAMAKQTANAPKETSAAEKILLQTELKRIEKRQKTLRDSYSENQSWSDCDKIEMKGLKQRRAELLSLLGFTV